MLLKLADDILALVEVGSVRFTPESQAGGEFTVGDFAAIELVVGVLLEECLEAFIALELLLMETGVEDWLGIILFDAPSEYFSLDLVDAKAEVGLVLVTTERLL